MKSTPHTIYVLFFSFTGVPRTKNRRQKEVVEERIELYNEEINVPLRIFLMNKIATDPLTFFSPFFYIFTLAFPFKSKLNARGAVKAALTIAPFLIRRTRKKSQISFIHSFKRNLNRRAVKWGFEGLVRELH